MLRIIKIELHKVLTGYGLYVCSLLTIILCFGTGIYHDTSNSNVYSVIKSFTSFNKEFMLNKTDCNCVNVILKGSGSWLTMFIPIISAFAFIPIVCDESESKSVRNAIFRTSKFKFYTSKFITACLSGGLAVTFGYILFAGFAYIMFPNINEYSIDTQEMYKETLLYSYPFIIKHGFVGVLIIKYVEIFIYGATASVPAILITSVTKNKYIVLCIPFFAKYAITQTCVKLSAKAYSDFENINENLGKFSSIIAPDSLLRVFEMQNKNLILLYNFGLVLIAFIIYLFIQGRKFDCGE